MDHITPFGARVEPPPVIHVALRPRTPFWLVALICSLSWAMAALSVFAAGVSAYYGLTKTEQQIAWRERV